MLYKEHGIDIQKTISITMRTPGSDTSLASGFLFTEGILKDRSQIKMIIPSADGNNTVLVILSDQVQPDMLSIQRNFYATSSCGVCGKASIESIRAVSVFSDIHNHLEIERSTIYSLAQTVEKHQVLFERTGGLHASALFTTTGELIHLAEDVGRHNALDKLIGYLFNENKLPLNDHILFLSGRTSFELVQKAYMAGIKIIAAVGAPSSLAVELAESSGITLIGFLRGKKFNVYAGIERIK
jgi:FdhD protein